MKTASIYYMEKYGPHFLLILSALCFYAVIFPAITTKYLYHNDVYYMLDDVFREIPHLLAIGRPIGALLLQLQLSFTSSPEDLVFSRQLTALLSALLSFATFHHLHKSWNTPPLAAAGIAAISFFLPSTILNVLWASQLPPNVVGVFLGLASSHALVAALPSNKLAAINTALRKLIYFAIRKPRNVSSEFRNLFCAANQKPLILSVIFISVGVLNYPLSTFYILTFPISGLLFSRGARELFRNIVRAKVAIIMASLSIGLVYISSKFLGLFFESYNSSKYNYDLNLDISLWMNVVVDLWMVVASIFVFPSSLETAAFFSLLFGAVLTVQAVKHLGGINRKHLVVFLLIAAALAIQCVFIVFGIRFPFHTNPDEYVMYRMTYSPAMSVAVLLLCSAWYGCGMIRVGGVLLPSFFIFVGVLFIVGFSFTNHVPVVRDFVKRESAILNKANEISSWGRETDIFVEFTKNNSGLNRLRDESWESMDRDYTEEAIFIPEYILNSRQAP